MYFGMSVVKNMLITTCIGITFSSTILLNYLIFPASCSMLRNWSLILLKFSTFIENGRLFFPFKTSLSMQYLNWVQANVQLKIQLYLKISTKTLYWNNSQGIAFRSPQDVPFCLHQNRCMNRSFGSLCLLCHLRRPWNTDILNLSIASQSINKFLHLKHTDYLM